MWCRIGKNDDDKKKTEREEQLKKRINNFRAR